MAKNTKKPSHDSGPEQPARLYSSAYAARLAKEVAAQAARPRRARSARKNKPPTRAE
jgi:phage tail sheath gpL-like